MASRMASLNCTCIFRLCLLAACLGCCVADVTATPGSKPAGLGSTIILGGRSLLDAAVLNAQPGSCSRPLAPVAGQPYCAVPSSVSTQAQNFLRRRGPHMGPNPLTILAADFAKEAFNKQLAPASAEAARKYLQSVRNETINEIPVTIGTPKALKPQNRDKIILMLHGGAYVHGSCYYYWHVSALIAYTASIPVVCVEYRLAPRHAHPAGLNDALAVYKDLIKKHKHKDIVIMGDSAGGGLALALTLKLKHDNIQLPGALVLMSPWSDLTKTGDTMTTLTGVDPLLQYELNLKLPALAYVGNNASRLQEPLLSPLWASYSAPWPHTYIQTGLRDSFLSSCVMLQRKLRPLRAAGIDIELSVWEGMWHVFHAVPDVPEALEASVEMAEFIQKHLGA